MFEQNLNCIFIGNSLIIKEPTDKLKEKLDVIIINILDTLIMYLLNGLKDKHL